MRKLIDPAHKTELAKQRNPESGQAHPHDSATLHVTGQARYVDDQPLLQQHLHVAVGLSPYASAAITDIDLCQVSRAPGVVTVVTSADVPGKLDIGPVFPGDPLLAEGCVNYVGQPVFAVAATSFRAAKQALKLAKVEYSPEEPCLDPLKALAQGQRLRPDHTIIQGDAEKSIAKAPHRLSGEIRSGGQEHFYLEGQISTASPNEDGQFHILTSSQHPGELQKLIAQLLNISMHQVVVEVRRMGGGFGGKETQAAFPACLATLLAWKTGRPVKCRLPRQDDMVITGKRHPFISRYEVGFNSQGVIAGLKLTHHANGGHSPDLTAAITDRAMFHSDNAYYLANAHITGHNCRTNLASNTAFRGFGGPQGVLVTEAIIDQIARHLGLDPLEVRKRNLYAQEGQLTPYDQPIENNVLPELIAQLEQSSNYQQRRQEIIEFNKKNPIIKKGIALTPVKFGISFTVKHLNQAGALINIYTDGSVILNHGGTEMGQGLFTKVAQLVADTLGISLDCIQVSSTRTDKVPNTSPTAASSGTDLNGQAACKAAHTLRQRLIAFAGRHYKTAEDEISISNNLVYIGEKQISFIELVQLAYLNRVQLSATGFYKTPKIFYDYARGKGHPFFYFATGAAVSEVLIDTLTGEYKVSQVDILHDVGRSINPAIDRGQIEGGFIQGMGWLTTEELVWDENGKLLSSGPATYKIPTINDTPTHFNVELYERDNPEETIYHSKAVGEPPLMLAISVWSALSDAIASLTGYKKSPLLSAPATPEQVLAAITACQKVTP